MTTYIRLLRIPNLFFLAFIQWMVHQTILQPILQKYGFESSQSSGSLWLLIAATVFIAAAGYVLNDYFDIKIDAINKPLKQVVGVTIPKQRAMFIHQLLTGIGVVCGLVLSYLTRSFTLAFIFIVVPGLLWFYSASYKRQFLIGNVVVAFVSGLSVLVVGITELAWLKLKYGQLLFQTPIPGDFYSWTGGLALFAFLCTWIRELIKDMEDETGDKEMECRTMPIVWGMGKTKIFLYVLISITIGALLVANFFYIPFQGNLTLKYIIFGIILPFIALTYLISKAQTSSEFHQASTLSKFIMVVGICYGIVFYFLMAQNYGISLFNLFYVK